jgi:hypothetical protein|tara:strand:- start:39 stop:239 length:201 start_codon:yes stop_codon:yes gene_type:complete
MDEQDYKNLIAVYQTKYFELINQTIALSARELKYQQTIESLTKQVTELEKKVPKPKRTTKDAGEFA